MGVGQPPPVSITTIQQETLYLPFPPAHLPRPCQYRLYKASPSERTVNVEISSLVTEGSGSNESPESPTGQHTRSASVPVSAVAPPGAQQHPQQLQHSFSQPPYTQHQQTLPQFAPVGPSQNYPGQGPPGGPGLVGLSTGGVHGYGPPPPGLGPPGHIISGPPIQPPPPPPQSSTTAKRAIPPHAAESPAKKQSKWSAEEDALIIELRGGGMKWEDISKRLPGRSPISCRLHYQNYLERRSEWDEERKNKLARLYERFKPEMWAKVAEEMAVPWRAAEAMHWQLGENDMARRAGVTPFSLDPSAAGHHRAATRHTHTQSQGSITRSYRSQAGPPPARGMPMPVPPTSQPSRHPYPAAPGSGGHSPLQKSEIPPITYGQGPPGHAAWPPSRHGSMGVPNAPLNHSPHMTHGVPTHVGGHGGGLGGYAAVPSGMGMGSQYHPSPNQNEPATSLPPLNQSASASGAGNRLPSLTEALASSGPGSRSTPAQSSGVPTASPVHSNTASPGPLSYLQQPGPGLGGSTMGPGQGSDMPGTGTGKRRASPDLGRDATRRRHMESESRRL
ncbi:Myb-related protein A [Zalerion maritima]|uniref:Myb-related protein A n=1 Tax=Zalerion maritima TaxID=339359 RepID=A0AAD5S3L0_9PEZI|nr:Myb-related protein A [Zalerion maritima]